YQIKRKKYQYEYKTYPALFGGSYRTIDARQISGGFVMYANYTETTHNTIDIIFHNTTDDLPKLNSTVANGDFFVTLDHYKGPHGDFYVLDKRYQGYFRFTHASDEYVEGTFDFKMVKANPNDYHDINPDKTIHLKNGKFKIQVY